jgi:hypothetical protein
MTVHKAYLLQKSMLYFYTNATLLLNQNRTPQRSYPNTLY